MDENGLHKHSQRLSAWTRHLIADSHRLIENSRRVSRESEWLRRQRLAPRHEDTVLSHLVGVLVYFAVLAFTAWLFS